MIENLVDVTIPDAAVNDCITKIAAARDALKSFLLYSLTPEQRRAMFKMGQDSSEYVQKSIDYAQDPDLRSDKLNLGEWNNDFSATRQYMKILTVLEPFYFDVTDMMMLCGSEAIDQAQVNYRFLRFQAAENEIKARGAYEDLKNMRWNQQRKPATKK